jgi:hypothetical protein
MRVPRSSASLAALVQSSGLKIASNMTHGWPARECEIKYCNLMVLTLVCSLAAVTEYHREMAVGRGDRGVVTYVDE